MDARETTGELNIYFQAKAYWGCTSFISLIFCCEKNTASNPGIIYLKEVRHKGNKKNCSVIITTQTCSQWPICQFQAFENSKKAFWLILRKY